MGGADTEVDETTKNIIVEVANFNMYAIRKASMRHGLFTDAVTRFNKGQSPLQNDRIIAKAIEFFHELAGAEQASDVADSRRLTDAVSTVLTDAHFINVRLGLQLSAEEMAELLRNVEFTVLVKEEQQLVVTTPFWRTDIEIPEDIVEEVGRLYGYDRLPRELPSRSVTPAEKNKAVSLKQDIRTSLARSGANEVLTYSFVHERLFEKAGQDKADAFTLGNALSPDLQHYRLSLIPSILDKVNMNVRAGYEEFALFEIGKTHNARLHANDDEGLPKEPGLVDLVYAATGKADVKGAAFYKVRRLLDQLASDLGVALEYSPFEDSDTDEQYPIMKPFDAKRSAYVSIKGSDNTIGIIGEFTASVARNFKLPKYSAGFTLGFEELLTAISEKTNNYHILSRFPGTYQDVCFRVDASLPFAELEASVEKALKENDIEIQSSVIDIFQNDPEYKQVTFRIEMTDHEATITGDRAGMVIKQLVEFVTKAHDATVV
jgi:phenylalanyl-tRNA synthetase beta chain